MVVDVHKAATDRRCIQLKLFSDQLKHLSLDEYESAQSLARGVSNWRARNFHEVGWAVDSPPVEQLTGEWQAVGRQKYRIVDREAYDVQMRRLLGIL
jgi:hypothetical protein